MTISTAQLRPALTIGEADLEQLKRWIDHAPDDTLYAELMRAQIVAANDVPDDVVRMNSRLVFVDTTSGARRTISLVFPNAADVTQGRISVLAPIGSAVLGLRVGDEIDWPLPNGRQTRLRIVDVSSGP